MRRGLCFNCGGRGHLSRDCPTPRPARFRVEAEIGTHAINISHGGASRNALYESTETADSLYVGSTHLALPIELEEGEAEVLDTWMGPIDFFEDCANRAEDLMKPDVEFNDEVISALKNVKIHDTTDEHLNSTDAGLGLLLEVSELPVSRRLDLQTIASDVAGACEDESPTKDHGPIPAYNAKMEREKPPAPPHVNPYDPLIADLAESILNFNANCDVEFPSANFDNDTLIDLDMTNDLQCKPKV
ncbi:hypothetical protein C8F04DRAFT_1270202 [Mycena alexandri]|uniref:CCHC-type domain-containing protein n=1 Tax=Mycena alexandri TaxID=1745969 RepID=A0AAD6SED2_9AGAR|nr:hypothetical protein C8F04DRAFT_1270202 [Mycena alexandri]